MKKSSKLNLGMKDLKQATILLAFVLQIKGNKELSKKVLKAIAALGAATSVASFKLEVQVPCIMALKFGFFNSMP